MRLHLLMLFLHLLGVVLWVGGMAFAYLCLRPALAVLPPPQRLGLMRDVLGRFFPLVWVALGCILVSGAAMLLRIGMRQAPGAWHLMLVTGLVMTGIFLSIWFGPWKRLVAAVARDDWAAGAQALDVIRRRVGLNLVLGLATMAVATLGLAL
jgi:uncharacterized membrane protein